MSSCGIHGTNSTTGSPATTPGSHVSSSTKTAAGTSAMTANTRRPSSLVASGVSSATAANAARQAIIHSPRARTVPSCQFTGRVPRRSGRVVCRERNRDRAVDGCREPVPACDAVAARRAGSTAPVGGGWSMPILISADELAHRLDEERAGRAASRTVVLDVRWTPRAARRPPGVPRRAHPGRRLRRPRPELADHDATGEGRHPLPSEAAFTAGDAALGAPRRRHGGGHRRPRQPVGRASLVAAAARGLRRRADARRRASARGWRRGIRSRRATACREPGDATAQFGAMPRHRRRRRGRRSRRAACCSTRARPSATAARSSPSTRAPATSPARGRLPTAGNLDADGRFLPPDALRERFAEVGIDAGHARPPRTAARASPPRTRWPRSRSPASTARSTPARGASGRTRRAGRSPRAPSRADDAITRGGGPPR